MDFNDPTFRNEVYNELLRQSENAAKARKAVNLLQGLDYNDLTPALWARIQIGAEALDSCVGNLENAIKASSKFLEDPKIKKLITDVLSAEGES